MLNDPQTWSQFGLSGLVIGALFFILWRVATGALSRFDTVINDHRQERKEWRESAERRDGNLEKALQEVAREIREVNKS